MINGDMDSFKIVNYYQTPFWLILILLKLDDLAKILLRQNQNNLCILRGSTVRPRTALHSPSPSRRHWSSEKPLHEDPKRRWFDPLECVEDRERSFIRTVKETPGGLRF